MPQQPERIQGAQYTVKSDVWSLGISLIELALGRFPFSQSTSDDESDSEYENTLSPSRPGVINLSQLPTKPKTKTKKKDKRKSKGVSLQGGGMTMSILELLQHIVNEPAPRLTPEGRYPKQAEEFVDACLLKDPDARKTPKELLVRYLIFLSCLDDLSNHRNSHGSSKFGSRQSTWKSGQALSKPCGCFEDNMSRRSEIRPDWSFPESFGLYFPVAILHCPVLHRY
jgi:serine/threonine protein kinase